MFLQRLYLCVTRIAAGNHPNVGEEWLFVKLPSFLLLHLAASGAALATFHKRPTNLPSAQPTRSFADARDRAMRNSAIGRVLAAVASVPGFDFIFYLSAIFVILVAQIVRK